MSVSKTARLLSPTEGSDSEVPANGPDYAVEEGDILYLLQNLDENILAIEERSRKNEQALEKRPLASEPASCSKKVKKTEST